MTLLHIRIPDPEAQRLVVMANSVFIQALSATPAQMDAWLVTNVTTLAQARPVLSMLMQGIAYLVNKESGSL